MNDKLECIIYGIDGKFYLIPEELKERFESVDYYDKDKEFSNYGLPIDLTIEGIFVNKLDMIALIEGDFE